MKIIVISDTHIPRVASDLPASLYAEVRSADMVLHAGDFVDAEVLERLKKLSPVTAVYGNMDSVELRRMLKQKEVVTAGRFRIGLIHGYGAPKDLMNTVRSEFGAVDAIVFGHSHTAVNVTRDGVLFFNPGSPTDTIFASSNSYGILNITDASLEGKIVRL